ncbi:MAG: zf-HC2 domain-containing protein [Gammaproteobacteria bacterium]|nr:zf-HC2 domain-containing protein [Gammaproteobacteria bacterium]
MADSADHFDWDERSQDWIDGDLDPSGSAALEAHIAGCARCRARRSAIQAVDSTLSRSLPREALSADFDRSVLARIERAPMSDRAAARARLEQAWQAEVGAFARQWRSALRSMVLNALLAAALLTAFLTRLPASASIARLNDQLGQFTLYASSRPVLAVAVMAVGMSIVALGLTRVFGERA